MSDTLQLMVGPFVACMALAAMMAYLGIHIIAREVIFVDLSLAQMAALGSTSALLFEVAPDSALGYAFSLSFTTLGAFIFAMTRTRSEIRRVPQEAIIGIVFVVASAAAILVATRSPTGAEQIKDVLVGSILWVTAGTIAKLALVFLAVGVFHWILRRRFFTISLDERAAEQQGWNMKLWDFLFYASFGLAITMAVPVAGVLLVFTFLVVPAVIAFLFTRKVSLLLAISWGVAAVTSAAGLVISFQFDLPTGPLIVCAFGLALLIAGVICRRCPVPRAASEAHQGAGSG
ncbi:MAG: metal ABC transporter permease [Gemmatimonadota bacterium]|nr:MAG: metal ABC transporter permease [Gemmatimonadota bacterium]